jgi:hypothetical protein
MTKYFCYTYMRRTFQKKGRDMKNSYMEEEFKKQRVDISICTPPYTHTHTHTHTHGYRPE